LCGFRKFKATQCRCGKCCERCMFGKQECVLCTLNRNRRDWTKNRAHVMAKNMHRTFWAEGKESEIVLFSQLFFFFSIELLYLSFKLQNGY
jgi:hypothetical protein